MGKTRRFFRILLAFMLINAILFNGNGHLQKVDAASNSGTVLVEQDASMILHYQAQSLLNDGSVLISGSANTPIKSTSIYDPTSKSFTYTGQLPYPVFENEQSTLPDGRVVTTGGSGGPGYTSGTSYPTNAVAIYDPSTGVWTQKASLPIPLQEHGQSTLKDGRIFVTGGRTGGGGNYSNNQQSFIYNPSNNTWTTASYLPSTLSTTAQVTLLNGNVLVIGGTKVYEYNPSTDTWTTKNNLSFSMDTDVITVLSNGDVFLVTGSQGFIYNPTSQNISLATNPPYGISDNAEMTTLKDGRVVILGSGWGSKKVCIYTFNSPPSITLVTADNQTLSASQSYVLTGNVADTDGDNLTVNYNLDNTLKFTEPKTSSASFSYDYGKLPIGTHSIKVSADDGKGGLVEKTLTAHVFNPPQNLIFNTITKNSISFTFDPNGNPNTVDYKIEGSTNGSSWTTLATQKTTSYTHSALQPNTDYFYRVSTVYPTGTNSTQIQGNAKTLPDKAVAPTVVPGATFNNISWNTVTGVNAYVIKQGATEIYRGSGTTFTHDNLTPNTSYTYTLTNENITGAGQTSDPVTAVTLANQPSQPNVQSVTAVSATIGWNANGNPNGTEYKITLEDGKTSGWTTQTSYSFSGLGNGQHTASIVARNSNNVETSPITFTFTTAPAAPLLDKVDVDSSSIKGKINPNGNLNGTEYTLQVFQGADLIHSIPWTTDLDFAVEDLESNTDYKLVVKARYNGIESDSHEEVIATYAQKPTDLNFTQKGLDAQFVWTSENPVGTEYMITLSSGETSGWITDTQYTFTDQQIGMEKTAVLKARNKNGVESEAISISFVINFDPPNNLTAGPVDGQTKTSEAVKLTWDTVPGATKYTIYRNKVKIGETQTTTFADTTVSPNTDYQYVVHAATTTFESQFGAEVLITTDAQTPINLVATEVKDTSYILTWDGGKNPKTTQYAIRINGEDQVGWITGNLLKISSATPFTEYTVELFARNRAGVESDPATIKVTTDGVYPVEDLQANATPESVSLTWADTKNPSDAVYYDIVREVPGLSSKRFRVAEKTLQDDSTRIGRSYSYTVYVVKYGMKSPGVRVGTTVPDYEPPAAITGLNANPGSKQIELTWDQHPTAEKFQIDRIDVKTGRKKTFSVPLGSEEGFTDTEVMASTTYEYSVMAIANNKKSEPAKIRVTSLAPDAPDAPTGITAEIKNNAIYVDWSDANEKYYVEIITDNGTKKDSETVLLSEYYHSRFSPGETFVFRVYGVTDGVKSTSYAEVIFTAPAMQLLPAPENVEWSYDSDKRTISITWDPVEGASSYQVETIVNGKPKTTKTTYLPKFEQTRVSADDEYKFRIRAKNGQNYELSISEIPQPVNNLAPVNNLQIDEKDTLKVTLSWEKPSTTKEVSYYTVERWSSGTRNLSKRVDDLTYLDTRDLVPEKEYEYRVYAKYSDGYASPVTKIYKTKPLPQLNKPLAEFRALQKYGSYQYVNITVNQSGGDRIQIVRKNTDGKVLKRKTLYDTNVYRDRVKVGKYIYEISVSKYNHVSGTATYTIDTDDLE
ncbi:fibronectin type III domain-containing protein [Brevibacillus centrosporus]|uniref:fibronectin type III domain-containing protein n=1 Tax=Brevibacillus centrosporus TaxID=54910 RepID=UPI003D22514F